MNFPLSQMNLAELRALSVQLQGELTRREQTEVAKAREQVIAIASKVGITIAELKSPKFGKTTRDAEPDRIVRKPKYRDPENSSNVWIGVGPRPSWLKEKLANGAQLDQLRI